jgi:hypothetical protein
VREELVSITRPQHLKGLMAPHEKSIVLHVRLGDFVAPEGESRIPSGAWCTRMPLPWYQSAIAACRRTLGSDTPVRVFSDGSDDELRPLLSIPRVRRASFGTSIADLHALSTAHVFIASGGSTFSMWASYLGRMPVVWHPRPIEVQTLLRPPRS